MRAFFLTIFIGLVPGLTSAQQFDPTGTWYCQGGIRAKQYTSGYEAIAQQSVMVVYANGTFERQGTDQGSSITIQTYISGNWWFDGQMFYTSGVRQSSHNGTSQWNDSIPVVAMNRMYKLQDLNSQVFLEQCDRR